MKDSVSIDKYNKMYTLEKSGFKTAINETFDRFSIGGGFLQGDVVKIKKAIVNSEWFKNQATTVQARLKEMINPGNKVYRISTLKSEVPRAAGSFGMSNLPCNQADIVREINPSFWMDPITVPLQYLELIDVGNDMPEYDKDLVRKDTTQIEPKNPEKMNDKTAEYQTQANDTSRYLPDLDSTMEYGNDWDDTKPGGGNTPKQKKHNIKQKYT